MDAVLCLRVEGEAAGVTEEIGVLMRALWSVRACASIEKVGAPHMVRRLGCEARTREEGKGGGQRRRQRYDVDAHLSQDGRLDLVNIPLLIAMDDDKNIGLALAIVDASKSHQ